MRRVVVTGMGLVSALGNDVESALARLGVCPAHRRSFGPVRDVLNPGLF